MSAGQERPEGSIAPGGDASSAVPAPDGDPREICAVTVAPWERAWSTRHTVAALVAGALAYVAYTPVTGHVGSAWQPPLLALLVAATALVVASYVPVRGSRPVLGSVCSYAPLAHLVFAGMFLAQGAAFPVGPVFAAVLAVLAVVQRTTGASSCAVR